MVSTERHVAPIAALVFAPLALLFALAMLAAPVAPARADALPILTDGYGDDWTVPPLVVDPAGDDGASGVDFRNVWVANDDDWLFIRFETTAEIDLNDGPDMILGIDADLNGPRASTSTTWGASTCGSSICARASSS